MNSNLVSFYITLKAAKCVRCICELFFISRNYDVVSEAWGKSQPQLIWKRKWKHISVSIRVFFSGKWCPGARRGTARTMAKGFVVKLTCNLNCGPYLPFSLFLFPHSPTPLKEVCSEEPLLGFSQALCGLAGQPPRSPLRPWGMEAAPYPKQVFYHMPLPQPPSHLTNVGLWTHPLQCKIQLWYLALIVDPLHWDVQAGHESNFSIRERHVGRGSWKPECKHHCSAL